MIVIVTATNDLHAVTVHNCIRRFGYRDCYIIECDRIAQGNVISYRIGGGDCLDRVRTHDSSYIALSDAKVIWLRRIRANQILNHPLTNEEGAEIVNNDCRGALSGLLSTKFHGKWISPPEASFRASDKIFQLFVAEKHGFRVPKTLVTQSVEDLRYFFDECEGKIIVKTVVGVSEPFLQTVKIIDPNHFPDEAYEASPAIYQEFIDGTYHLRLLCFGDRSLCGVIQTNEIDWRPNLNVSIDRWPVPDDLHAKVRLVLDELGLAMGVVDIKISSEEEFVWLEVNPQGQFMFLEPLTGINFINEFSKYLLEEVATARV